MLETLPDGKLSKFWDLKKKLYLLSLHFGINISIGGFEELINVAKGERLIS